MNGVDVVLDELGANVIDDSRNAKVDEEFHQSKQAPKPRLMRR